jgi:hypothetical protein
MPTQQPANPLWSALWLQRALRFISAAHKRRQQNRPYQSWLCQSAVVKNSAKHRYYKKLSLLLKAQCRLNLAKPENKNQINQLHQNHPSVSSGFATKASVKRKGDELTERVSERR